MKGVDCEEQELRKEGRERVGQSKFQKWYITSGAYELFKGHAPTHLNKCVVWDRYMVDM